MKFLPLSLSALILFGAPYNAIAMVDTCEICVQYQACIINYLLVNKDQHEDLIMQAYQHCEKNPSFNKLSNKNNIAEFAKKHYEEYLFSVAQNPEFYDDWLKKTTGDAIKLCMSYECTACGGEGETGTLYHYWHFVKWPENFSTSLLSAMVPVSCEKCPDDGITSSPYANDIGSCYKPKGTVFSDETGSYTYNYDCYYSK